MYLCVYIYIYICIHIHVCMPLLSPCIVITTKWLERRPGKRLLPFPPLFSHFVCIYVPVCVYIYIYMHTYSCMHAASCPMHSDHHKVA